MPKLPSGRVRRIKQDEYEAILANTDSTLLIPLVTLAIETGVRRSELVALKGKNLDIFKRTLLIPTSKNGEARQIPLSPIALKLMTSVSANNKGKLFDITSHAITVACGKACKRANL